MVAHRPQDKFVVFKKKELKIKINKERNCLQGTAEMRTAQTQ